MPHTSALGLALIARYEGERLRAYPDPGTGGAPWTIGFGHTANVHPGDVCTPAQALEFLRQDVANAERAVVAAVHVTLSPHQFDALVSFQYNTGALVGSTLLNCVNLRDWEGAASQFGRWIHAGGMALPGLIARRDAERALFLS